MNANPQRPRRQSLTQQCVESMKQHIQQQRLEPGARLPTEQDWAEMLGVSRLVVREALQVLAGIGLIEIKQGRGTFLRDIAEASVFDQLTFGLDLQQLTYANVFEARAMLDLTVLELCMQRADAEAIAGLEAVLQTMRITEPDTPVYHDLHRDFHRRMLRAAGNPLIERIGIMLMDTFWQLGATVPNLYFPSGHSHADQLVAHQQLIDAIKAGDLAQSRALVSQHLPIAPGSQHLFPVAFTANLATPARLAERRA